MCRSYRTIQRKLAEARDKRELAASKRREAQNNLNEANRLQGMEEEMDDEADTAQAHSEQLSSERKGSLDKIEDCHHRIDGFNLEMSRYKDLEFCTNPSSSQRTVRGGLMSAEPELGHSRN